MLFQKDLIINNETYTLEWSEKEINSIIKFERLASEFKTLTRDIDFSKIACKISATIKQPIEVKSELLDNNNISILLHKMRPFILQKESTFLPKVCKILSREIKDEHSRKFIKQAIKVYITEQNKTINSDEVFKLWINSSEYHYDEEKIFEIDRLLEFIPQNLFIYLMHEVIIRKTNSIIKILEIVDAILNHRKIGVVIPLSSTLK